MLNIKKLRNDLGLSQSEIADILGITQGFVSRIENGRDMFPSEHLPKLKELYGEKVDKYMVVNQKNIIGDNIAGNKNIEGDSIQGTHITINNSNIDKFIDLFKEKNGQIDKCQNQISKSQEQISVGQEQISKYIEHVDKLLCIIEKLTDK